MAAEGSLPTGLASAALSREGSGLGVLGYEPEAGSVREIVTAFNGALASLTTGIT